MWKSAQHLPGGFRRENLMYSHETEQQYWSWYLIINVFELVINHFIPSLPQNSWYLVTDNVVLLTEGAFEVDN